ncbi:type VI secretion system-associated protein TagF [Agrobacterium sp. a22-2]|uniref:type VI secretion system-associated protein TagF n=1 Tax=Agrobacterium sp. a22-2 TaxID=2283840 RepID=UPI0014467F45|nr:type VI secretion system-associated protein TagF [Agrobacterium sp. a22-2]NKN37373.1 type VI secretion system-associated protein TagF [Agrobacterium sp. a22-2]
MSERAPLEQNTPDADRIGFFGKLPSHGDFVATGLSRHVQAAIDSWLQAGLQLMQEPGTNWEKRFRAMPAWRFVIDRGLWAPAVIAGVIVASRDRVERSFPLVIAAQIHDFSGDIRRLCRDDTWFVAIEGIAETSGLSSFDVGTFTASLKRLRSLRPADMDVHLSYNSAKPGTRWWRIDPQDRMVREFQTAGPPEPKDFLRLVGPETSSPSVAPAVRPVTSKGATPVLRSVVHPEPVVRQERLTLGQPPRWTLRHSVTSHPGTRLLLNGDALTAQENPTLFAIADGVGDNSAAVEAGRVVATVLGETTAQESIEALAQTIKGKFGRAHGLLQSAYYSSDPDVPRAAAVALASVDQHFAVLWAGDARCYIVRDGLMRCLTRDHVKIGLRRRLSRGIGLQGQLMPEMLVDRLQKGDRFLLCSNPLTRVLPERGIAEILLSTDLDHAAAILCQEALIANCRENLSAMVIDVMTVNVG